MTVGEIKDLVMFQTNNDADDLGDFLPYLDSYIASGYDQIVYAWAEEHPTADSEEWPLLTEDTDEPATPGWTHPYLADWATWMIYRNGNVLKQNRGMQYLSSFREGLSKITLSGGKDGKVRNFFNIPE